MNLQEASSNSTNNEVVLNADEAYTETIIIEVVSDPEETTNESIEEITDEEKQSTTKQTRKLRTSKRTKNCKNKSCNFNCKNVKLLSKHSKTCDKKLGQQSKEEIKKPNPWYKCCICNTILRKQGSMDSHSRIHAREEGELYLKVKFMKYVEGVFQKFIVRYADPLYKPPPSNRNPNTVLNDGLNYDPNKPVFKCDKCNYKTNHTEDLNKHKKLHYWNPEKHKNFETNTWFTCNICYFYSLDKERYMKHFHTHKEENYT